MENEQPAGWQPDPTGRNAERYWDGAAWSDQVADDAGTVSTDPMVAPAAGAVPPPPPARKGRSKVALVVVLVVVLVGVAAVAGALFAAGGGDADDDVALEASEEVDEATTTTEEETTTTSEATTTSTTVVESVDEVVGSDIAVALGNLTDAGFEVTQVEVIDDTVPDGQVTQAVEQPDGSVVVTVARPPVTRFLEELAPVQGSTTGPTFNVSGTTYSHGVFATAANDGRSFEYDLGRDFRRFQATAGILDTSNSVARARVEISLDGEIVSTNDIAFGETLAVDLDVTGKLRLRIVLVTLANVSCCNAVEVGFGDGRLLGVPSEVPPLPN